MCGRTSDGAPGFNAALCLNTGTCGVFILHLDWCWLTVQLVYRTSISYQSVQIYTIIQIYLKVSVIDYTSTLNHSPQTSLVGSLEEGTLVKMFLLAKHRGSYSSLLITSRNTVPFVLHAARYLLNSLRF